MKSSRRCIYCGRLEIDLSILTDERPICQCCDHCFECKTITKFHKNDNSPASTSDVESKKIADDIQDWAESFYDLDKINLKSDR